MGTEVHIKSNLTAYLSMRDLNEDSNGCSWPIIYGDKALQNGLYQNGVLPRAATDAYLVYDKDIVKQTMLEHEAIFRDQVCELHRLYGRQRVLMDKWKRKDLQKSQVPNETSLASSSLMSHNTCEGARKWQISSGPLVSPSQVRPSTSEFMHSPVSSAKGETVFASQNGGSLNTSESRPSKVRRKMFDLHLPADQYIDTDEQDPPKDDNSQGTFGSFGDQDHKAKTENGVNLFFGKKEFDAKGRNMADLNEPVSVEDTNPFSNGESAKSQPSFLGLPPESSLNSHNGNRTETANSFPSGSDVKGRGWLSHVLEPGDGRGKKSVFRGVWANSYMPQQQMQGLFNKVHETPSYSHADQKVGLSRDRSFCGFGMSESIKSPESVLVSQFPSQLPIASSDDLSKSSWPQSVSIWEKPGSSLTQKPLPVEIHQFEASQRAAQSYGIFSEKWQDRNVASSNSGFGELPNRQNGFYHGSSSGSKELSGLNHVPSLSYDYFKSHNDGGVNLNVIPRSGPNDPVLTQGFGIANVERKQREDEMVTLPWLRAKAVGKSELVVINDLNSREPKLLDSSPPLLASKNEAGKWGQCSSEADLKRVDVGECLSDRKLFGRPVFDRPKNEPSSLNSLSHRSEGKVVENERKVRLLDINLPCDPFPELTREENSAGTEIVQNKGSDPIPKSSCSRHQIIDLNSCLSEDETSLAPPVLYTDRKHMPIIDLEVPAVPENEDDVFTGQVLEQPRETSVQKPEESMDDLCKVAAEAIVAISSACLKDCASDTVEDLTECKEDRLNWFVDLILSCGVPDESRPRACSWRGKSDGGNDCESPSEEVDFFELMTLKLTETKSEDYLPKPFVPETFDVDESAAATSAPARPRRGQARRGRQRRDFQRDILPGLASLSRHEVTEDLQTFGGLMRATGYHSWQSGLTRRNSSRNGPARGRRRSTVAVSVSPSSGSGSPGPTLTPLIQQLNNIETGGLEERKSLTGWGKTTRRPRRQRCPAGNPPIIHLT
ncbi:hypothetical protein CDL15_Pgr009554 [Punica granatum]|uniref:Uncharacterized protein n=1 Tax=Punica granatum TaxID=22663 RepID=A0A218WU49_PUNGR|nr:hypothetical protein CDL15_Pgr009554 [Punica granatum]